MKKAVIFDRDGTLIIDKGYLNDPDGVVYLDGVFEALRLLRDKGYIFMVATNQSGIARRIVDMSQLDAIHSKLRGDFARHGIELRGFYYAPHSVESNHYARKPNPGMLQYAARDFGIDLTASWMVGDRLTDVIAGHRAGCRAILLEGLEKDIPPESRPDYLAKDISDAARYIALNSDHII